MGADPKISAHFAGHMAFLMAIDGSLSTFVASPSQPTRRMAASSGALLALRIFVRRLEPSFSGFDVACLRGGTSLPSLPVPVLPTIEFRSGVATFPTPPDQAAGLRFLHFAGEA